MNIYFVVELLNKVEMRNKMGSRKALAIKYRPTSFDDVVEQNSVKIILEQQIKDNIIFQRNNKSLPGPYCIQTAQSLFSHLP